MRAMGGRLARPAVAGRGLVCQFGPVRAVDDVSFEVAQGEVFGLLGPNGAGKTTVIRVVTTLLKPVAGTMEVFGLDTRRSTVRVRRLIGYVPQEDQQQQPSFASVPRLAAPGRSASVATMWRLHNAATAQLPYRPARTPRWHAGGLPAWRKLTSCRSGQWVLGRSGRTPWPSAEERLCTSTRAYEREGRT
jgi:ABC transporter